MDIDEFIRECIANPLIKRAKEAEAEFHGKYVSAEDFVLAVWNNAHPIVYPDDSHGWGLGSYEIVELIRKFAKDIDVTTKEKA